MLHAENMQKVNPAEYQLSECCSEQEMIPEITQCLQLLNFVGFSGELGRNVYTDQKLCSK